MSSRTAPPNKALGPNDFVKITMGDGTVIRTHDDVAAYLRKRQEEQPDTQVPPDGARSIAPHFEVPGKPL